MSYGDSKVEDARLMHLRQSAETMDYQEMAATAFGCKPEADLLREIAELRASYSRLRDAMTKIAKPRALPLSTNASQELMGIAYRSLAETPEASLEAIRAEERQACALLLERMAVPLEDDDQAQALMEGALSIRARGAK